MSENIAAVEDARTALHADDASPASDAPPTARPAGEAAAGAGAAPAAASTARGRGALIEAADRIGAQLCRDAVFAGERCNWLGPSMEYVDGTWQVVHRAYGPDFYAGTSGIALFLAALHARTGEPQFRRVAEAALRHAFSRADALREAPARAGVYSGLLGIAYAALEAADALDADEPRDRARTLLEELAREGPVATALDVVEGCAGAIPALLRVRGALADGTLTRLAAAHGDALLSKSRAHGPHIVWDTLPGMTSGPLTGLAHGAAGIAWALLELHAATGNDAYRAAATRAVAYEQSLFSATHDNWPDLRSGDGTAMAGAGTSYGVAWCHGAPGIGLARTRAFRLTGDPQYRAHAEAALRSTRRYLDAARAADDADMSFCHGMGGGIELLLHAADAFGSADVRETAESLLHEAVERYRDRPWPCGVPGGGETPGLMLGIAGIGHLLLRAGADAPPASILLIAPD